MRNVVWWLAWKEEGIMCNPKEDWEKTGSKPLRILWYVKGVNCCCKCVSVCACVCVVVFVHACVCLLKKWEGEKSWEREMSTTWVLQSIVLISMEKLSFSLNAVSPLNITTFKIFVFLYFVHMSVLFTKKWFSYRKLPAIAF